MVAVIDDQDRGARSVPVIVERAVQHTVMQVAGEWYRLVGELEERGPRGAIRAGFDDDDGTVHGSRR
jgi:hypothetical protein